MGSGEAKKFRAIYGSAGRHGESFWSEEKDNVGLKLLKSMGWGMGEGLGKNNQGRTDAVKQFRKKDNSGIGAGAGTRDEAFRASQDLFNGILSRLNGGGDEGNSKGESASELGSAANTVSGMVAKRHLAGRFRRAKDMSMVGACDMAALLGKTAPVQPKPGEGDADKASAASTDPLQNMSTVSMTDYFAKKRLALGVSYPTPEPAPRARGFTLDQQADFAEEQMAMSYSGRGGLGLGRPSYDEGENNGNYGGWSTGRSSAFSGGPVYTDKSWKPPPAEPAKAPSEATSVEEQPAEDNAAAERKAAKAAKKARKAKKAERKAAKEKKEKGGKKQQKVAKAAAKGEGAKAEKSKRKQDEPEQPKKKKKKKA